jgi:hypothetical protein
LERDLVNKRTEYEGERSQNIDRIAILHAELQKIQASSKIAEEKLKIFEAEKGRVET